MSSEPYGHVNRRFIFINLIDIYFATMLSFFMFFLEIYLTVFNRIFFKISVSNHMVLILNA
jgi:hypothetical protein